MYIKATFIGSSSEGEIQVQHHRLRRDETQTTTTGSTSLGKKKPSQEDMLLVQSIQITDIFGFDKQQQATKSTGYDSNETVFISSDNAQGFCVNAIGKCDYVLVPFFICRCLILLSIETYVSIWLVG